MAYTIEIVDASCEEAAEVIERLSDALNTITGDSGQSSFDPEETKGARARFVLARDEVGRAVGCGAYRPIDERVAELKRMYSAPNAFAGQAILQFLESEAFRDGYSQTWLSTRKVNARAIRFYERHGYSRISNYGRYLGRAESICLGKQLNSHSLR